LGITTTLIEDSDVGLLRQEIGELDVARVRAAVGRDAANRSLG